MATSSDERQYRRETFDQESVPVEWPDGSVWYLPRPRIVYRRGRVDEKTIARQGRSFGIDFESLVDRVTKAEGDAEFIGSLFALAEDLIGRNYEVPIGVLDRLLTFEVDPDADGLPPPWDEVMRIGLSLPPKANAAGTSPPS